MRLQRIFHQSLARMAARWPMLSKKLIAAFEPMEVTFTPWQSPSKPLNQSKLAMVTTAGLHHRDQEPFNMKDANGDPSFRIIEGGNIEADYRITHDYYDHRDADKDLNVVFPITRLKEMEDAGCIGAISDKHFSFMGHIDGQHVPTLIHESTPKVVQLLKQMEVDIVLLTPA